MECRITVLCDNTVLGLGFLGEHGFAALVEIPGQKILFDTGQGFALIQNSMRLKKDLKDVSKVVLSHGHTDHVGGLAAFLAVKGACPVVAHPEVFSERFRLIPAGDGQQKPLFNGMPWPELYLTTRGATFDWRRDFTEIAPNVFITGEVPRKTLFELGSPKLVVSRNGSFVQDPFLDDFSLVLKTSRGLVVVLGCAHAGIVNILNHAIEKTGEKRVYAVLGGTHLGLSPEGQLNPSIEALKELNIQKLAVSHCTGQAAMARLAYEFGDGFAFGCVGFVLEVVS
ncbi:MAG: MBL fold metallo-hydrolase [Deltaproteobacteria bacterium]|nr:MBL fold metallo-hydrolase [Deltaproteobacteria bacterium]